MLLWRVFVRQTFISLFAAVCCASPPYGGSTLAESQHPAHFIFLIDASGSTMASKSRRDRYRAVLLQQVLPQLYAGTLSAGMPPFDPQRDFVSVFHFGAVDHSVKRALKGLAVVDFASSEIHPIRIAAKRAERDEIGSWLLPNQTYQYTFLTLANL